MYIPKQFQEQRIQRLADAIRDIQLGTLVTSSRDAYHTSHIPMIFKETPQGMLLEGHVARANEHWQVVEEPKPSIVIFMGPQAYISPSWYATKQEHGRVVPTWNYLVVQAEGVVSSVHDRDWLMQHLEELVELNEAYRQSPWAIADAPQEFIEKLSQAIVGIRFTVNTLVGCWKMIQNRSAVDRLGAVSGLLSSSESGDSAVASVMEQLELERGD
jgi:transcriptional regulator